MAPALADPLFDGPSLTQYPADSVLGWNPCLRRAGQLCRMGGSTTRGLSSYLSGAILKKLNSTGATMTAAANVKPGACLFRAVLLDAGSQKLGSGSDNIIIL